MAISLAEHDSLFVVSGLKSFALPARLAALFRIPSDATPAERVSSFLNAEDNPLLYAAFDEITARSDVVGSEILFDENREERIFNGDVVFKTSEKLADDDFLFVCSVKSPMSTFRSSNLNCKLFSSGSIYCAICVFTVPNWKLFRVYRWSARLLFCFG